MKADKPSYVYITGYGRSGSTIAELLLGEILPDCLTFGEIRFVHNEFHSRGICSCGEGRASCPYWGDDKINQLVTAINEQLDSHSPDLELVSASVSGFIQRVSEIRGSEVAYVVDSSKNAYGAFLRPLRLLGAYSGTKVLFIHRPFLDVMKSIYRGYNREKVESSLFRGSFSRVVRSMAVYIPSFLVNSYLQLTGRALRINYRDLIEDCPGTAKRILDYLGADTVRLGDNAKVVTGNNSHLISGNRLAKSLPMTIEKKD